MNNFPVKVDGKEYWISRSVAVVGFVFRHNVKTNSIDVLVEKRGEGAADFHGKLCVPCGYIDFNETGEAGIAREIAEETSLNIPPQQMQLFAVDTRPSSNRQNISLYYMTVVEDMSLTPNSKLAVGGEENEVEWSKWLTVATYNDSTYKFVGTHILKDKKQWAFGHNNDIETCLRLLFNNRYETTESWENNLKTVKEVNI